MRNGSATCSCFQSTPQYSISMCIDVNSVLVLRKKAFQSNNVQFKYKAQSASNLALFKNYY